MSQARAITCEAIERKSREDLYERLERLIKKSHSSLEEAYILLAWNFKWHEDADGVTRLYQVSRVQEIFRDLTTYDAVFVLNHTALNASAWTDKMTDAVLDACCCALQVATDAEGERREDTKGRTIYRIRKAPVQVFPESVKRHGAIGPHFEQLEATIKSKQKTLALDLPEEEEPSNGNGSHEQLVEMLVDGNGWKKGDRFTVKSEGQAGEVCIEVAGSQRLVAAKEYRAVN